jgi:Xaa-Pro aminopeptidase
MPDAPEIPFPLTDTEAEPTDEQLEQLMDHVAESVRQKESLRRPKISAAEISAMADRLIEQLLNGED